MNCEDCKNYKPSKLNAGGRCKFKPKIARFPDDSCNMLGGSGGFEAIKEPKKQVDMIPLEDDQWGTAQK